MAGTCPPIRVAPEDVPPELADNPLVKFWQTMTPAQEDVLEHLAELDRQELSREDECARADPQGEPAMHP